LLTKLFYIWPSSIPVIRLFYIIIALFFFSGTIRSQAFEMAGRDTINKVDATGRKQGKWILKGRHKPGSCYAADQKAEEGSYIDNRKTGIWIDYYCNGKMRNKLTFVNGRPDGYAQMFHENGKISEEGNWKNNRWIGRYKLYYANGEVQHEFVFNQSGRREGRQVYYHENGQLAIEGNFADGKESGVIKEYYENGDLKAEKNFADGAIDVASIKEYQPKRPIPKRSDIPEENAPVIKVRDDEKPNEAEKPVAAGPVVLNGQYTLYNKNKQITKTGIFKDNRFIEGKAYFYDDNGIIQRIAMYRNGMYIGDTQVEN
jgi:antitoxin component YwqK of YwqJK toxin-antitoxin module